MACKIFDGKLLSKQILQLLKQEITSYRELKSITTFPKLAYICAGNDPSVLHYLKIKHRVCEELNIETLPFKFSEDVQESTIIAKINELNQDSSVNGILIQLPLSPHLTPQNLLDAVSTHKDVDGLNSSNIGKLALKHIMPEYFPCTPLGCIEILRKNNIEVGGRHTVILGRSNLAGMSLALMLQKYDSTVTICHRATRNIESIMRIADILVVAIGSPHFVRADMVREGVVVLDIGINSVNGKLVGDVHPEVAEKASFFTPVPGGVGPMTVAMLMRNLVQSWQKSQ